MERRMRKLFTGAVGATQAESAPNQQALPSPFTSAATWQHRVDTYETFMKNVISNHKTLQPDKLNGDHEKIMGVVTNVMSPEDKGDISSFLDARWCLMVEQQEEDISNMVGQTFESCLYIYLSRDWVYVGAVTKLLGYINIRFGNPYKTGFAAVIKHSNGKLAWSDDYDNVSKDGDGNTLSVDSIWYHAQHAATGSIISRQFVSELLERVKKSVDTQMRAKISKVVFAIPNSYNYRERALLHNCCSWAGFQRTALFNESYVSACHALSKCQVGTLYPPPISILVISTAYPYGMRIFEYGESGVEQLSAAVSTGLSMECMTGAYRRAVSRLSIQQENSLLCYSILYEYNSPFHLELNVYLSDTLGLKLVDDVALNDNLQQVFALLSNTPSKPEPVQEQHSSTNFEKAVPGTSSKTIPEKGIGTKKETPPMAKIPLQIQSPDGSTCTILAYTDWTVKKLKDEVTRIQGSRDPIELEYTRTSKLNDNNFLNAYKLEPDTILQVKSNKYNKAKQLPVRVRAINMDTCPIIANCVARENETEEETVDGIKEGGLVLARTDLENLTMGEVGATCKINGHDDRVFVAVKFRKNLPLGSSGIRIEHVTGVDEPCDKCKGRKCLFIPLELIGTSKDYLFEVQ